MSQTSSPLESSDQMGPREALDQSVNRSFPKRKKTYLSYVLSGKSEVASVSSRDIRYDVLRAIAAFSVVTLHTSAQVVGNRPDVTSAYWWIGNVIDACTRWSVPVFIMVSGALLLGETGPFSDSWRCAMKRVGRTLRVLLVWSAVYFIVRVMASDRASAGQFVRDFIFGSPYYHLWYLYMLIGMYYVAPYVNRVFTQLSQAERLILVFSLFAIASVEMLLTRFVGAVRPRTGLSLFVEYLGYFVLGGLCREYLCHTAAKQYSRMRYLLVALFSSLVVAAAVGGALPYLGARAWGVMYCYLNPLVVIASYCAFGLALRTRGTGRFVRLISRLAPLTLGVYLVHPIFLLLLHRSACWSSVTRSLVAVPLTALVAFLASCCSTWLVIRIRWLSRVVLY